MPDRDYDLFEKLADGEVWKLTVHGRENAIVKLEELARMSANECYAIYLPTMEIVARVNVKQGDQG